MPKNIGVALYTYDRVDDARINMEIIKGIWEKSGLFNKVFIIHSFNGNEDWYPEKYLEDRYVRIKNRGHFSGAADLIESGVNIFINEYDDIDYIVTLAADTWLLNPAFINNIVEKMDTEKKYLAASCWGAPFKTNPIEMGLSTDFFVVNKKMAKDTQLFPFKWDEFYEKHYEVLLYQKTIVYLEKLFMVRFFESAQRYFGPSVSDHVIYNKKDELLYRIKEREPVHNYYADLIYRTNAPIKERIKNFLKISSDTYRVMYWPKIELLTHHDPIQKQKDLKKHKTPDMVYTDKFIKADNLSYFNNYEKNAFLDLKTN